ncbi:MAG: DUF2281 domain-containing protein [Bryobacteraceae bacterium]
MNKKDIVVRQLDGVPEEDFDALLGFIHSLKSGNAADAGAPVLLAESSLMEDWLSPDEEAAWADLREGTSILRSISGEAVSGTGSRGPER